MANNDEGGITLSEDIRQELTRVLGDAHISLVTIREMAADVVGSPKASFHLLTAIEDAALLAAHRIDLCVRALGDPPAGTFYAETESIAAMVKLRDINPVT